MYVEATNLYKNLVLVGDNFSSFESKFHESASQLKSDTNTLSFVTNDIKNATNALSHMVDALADSAPTDKQHLAKRSRLRDLVHLVMMNKS
jgi:uncharacterized protein Smg (DUF494 family)